MNTPIYIKMDAPEQLLLAEGVFRQLNILTYHPDVVQGKERGKSQKKEGTKQNGDESKQYENGSLIKKNRETRCKVATEGGVGVER